MFEEVGIPKEIWDTFNDDEKWRCVNNYLERVQIYKEIIGMILQEVKLNGKLKPEYYLLYSNEMKAAANNMTISTVS